MILYCNKANFKSFIGFLIIRCVYIYSVVLILGKMYYPGTGSYRIDFNVQKELLALFIFVYTTLLYLLTKRQGNFKENILFFLYVLYYIPMNTAYSIHNLSLEFCLLSNFYFIAIIILTSVKQNKSVYIENNSFTNSLNDMKLLLVGIIICLIYIAYKISYNGFSINLSIASTDVYANREIYAIQGPRNGSLEAYVVILLAQLTSYAAPVCLLIALKAKRHLAALIAFMCILAEYSVASMKTVLFFIPIVIAIYFIDKYQIMNRLKKITIAGLCALLILTIIMKLLFDFSGVYTLVLRRIMFAPAWLNALYFEFFKSHPKVWWSDDTFILQRILPPVYDKSILETINLYYFGQNSSPNTGMFAEAYMHFGAIGCFIYPVFVSLLLHWSDSVYKNYDTQIGALVAINAAIQMTNIPIMRTDFVLSFILFTILMKYLSKIHLPSVHFNVWGRRKLKYGK